MLLHDLAGRARGKGIAAAGQISARDRLGDRSGGRRNDRPLKPDFLARRGGAADLPAADRGIGRRPRHREYRQHIAHAVRHCDRCREAARPRFANCLRKDPLHIGNRKRL